MQQEKEEQRDVTSMNTVHLEWYIDINPKKWKK